MSFRTPIPASPGVATPTGPALGFIPELHGLRGLALAMVVLFHLFGRGRVSGGIDVFLVLSGFLVTASLAQRAITTARIPLARHYARLGLRLVPAAAVVWVAVALGTVLLLTPNQWLGVTSQLAASAAYAENWYLIDSQQEYGAPGVTAGPLQHFWSLSVQGQFFIVWPLVILALVRLARQFGWRPRRALLVGTLALTAASFGFASLMMANDQQVAYFHTATRFWELGAGALLALMLPRLRVADRWRAVLGWGGLVLILSSGLLWDGAQTFPGPAAAWPVAGAIAVLVSSGATGGRTVGRVLNSRPLHWLGDISYPLYLWHWPLIVFYLAARHHRVVGVLAGAGLLALSLGLAWLTQRYVAAPALAARERLTPRRTVRLVLVPLLATVVALSGTAQLLELVSDASITAAGNADHPGAAVIASDGSVSAASYAAPPLPDTLSAARDKPPQYRQNCLQSYKREEIYTAVKVCPPRGTKGIPEKTIVVTGGSHADQWLPAFEAIAAARNWRVIAVSKGDCPFVGDYRGQVLTRQLDPTCLEWNRSAEAVIRSLHPDALVVRGTRTFQQRAESADRPPMDTWRRLADAGITILAMRDTPRFSDAPLECLARGGTSQGCGKPRAAVYRATNPLFEMPDRPARVVPIDLTSELCPQLWCPAEIGNVMVYRDKTHLTSTYVRTMTPNLLTALKQEAPWLF